MPNFIASIFEKPVNRPIEGVIKADDQASLRIELEEYVITNEIEKHLSKFLDAYNNYVNANGVWISGFFGSGKSHLLKMLALVLEDREIEGRQAAEFFLDKLSGNKLLQAELERAVRVPSRSILFNIDQKAVVISKKQIDALLAVFQKVFDEACGYYGKQAFIAQFERDLDGRGKLQAFKDAFKNIAGQSWEIGREQYVLEAENVSKAYATISDKNADAKRDILKEYREHYTLSIEDFANRVRDYVNAQQKGFRLNFFVDEIGQYIADNIKLMTNLQTIAESLATKCRGQAWIIVTAQQDMNAVIGDMTKQQENDFSKIQARFANRMPLNSADVPEVIQRRLLSKTSAGKVELQRLYEAESNNLRTLFDFTDGSRIFKNFRNCEHFVNSYPFVPYQYELFQAAIRNLSEHNAFEGRHSSVGERSMLGVFQEVAVHVAKLPVGAIATFDLMFEGIRSALKASVQQSILVAEKNLSSDFAVRVLKALFLVKYVREFKATPHNICVLMTDRFDVDLSKLKSQVNEALALLEQQIYIQRNGDVYEYLTDEEKDIEEEIKNTEIDRSEITKLLEELIFDGVIKRRKLTHEQTGHEYNYSRFLDHQMQGRDYELGIDIITPYHDDAEKPDAFKAKSMTTDTLLIVLAPDERLMRDVQLYKQTDKYIRQQRAGGQNQTIETIINQKGAQNDLRLRDLTLRLNRAIASSHMLVRGETINARGEDAQTRVHQAFQTLIEKVYSNLSMLRKQKYEEASLSHYYDLSKDNLIGGESSLSESEQEILNFAKSQERRGIRTTMKSVTEQFERGPYGWPYAAILCNAAALLGRGKLEAKQDSNILAGDTLLRKLKSTQDHASIILEAQDDFSSVQVRALKDFYKEFFDSPPEASEAKALALETQGQLKSLAQELNGYVQQSDVYPFLKMLEDPIDKLRSVTAKSYKWLLTDLRGEEESLLQLRENIIEPIKQFMSGPQREIYNEAKRFLQDQRANFDFVGMRDAHDIEAVLGSADCFRGGVIQGLKAKLGDLGRGIEARLGEERAKAKSDFKEISSRILKAPGIDKLAPERRAEIDEAINSALLRIEQATLIAVIRDLLNRFRDETYPQLMAKISAGAVILDNERGRNSDGDKSGAQPSPQFEPVSRVHVEFPISVLASESDIDGYLDAFRSALVVGLKAGKRYTV